MMPTRKECANALRILAIDAVEQAKSGHPGAPLGMADMAEAVWRHFLRHNPANPHWANRDRFVLSNGHASALLYGLLHLTGYDVSLEDMRQFRQLGSKTPGHPEYRHTPGVELTTGPLGQGIAMAVGMALAEKMLAAQYNRPEYNIVDHHTWVFLGDGCMMEGISHEACSLAGTLGLGKLIALYDANNISIDGHISGWFDEDVASRFQAYGWHVQRSVDGHDAAALDAALTAAVAETARPSLIICHTHIGFGSPKVGSASCHGSPLGAEAVEATRRSLGWTAPPFSIPADIAHAWDARTTGAEAEAHWQGLYTAYAAAHPLLAEELTRRTAGLLPEGWQQRMAQCIASMNAAQDNIATRVASQKVLEALLPDMPELVGGSADLTGSVGTWTKTSRAVGKHHADGNYIYYGVREFAMGAVMNGLALHGGILPYAGTFMIFSDYAKNAIRLSALMGVRVVWVLTHDSIGVGEDGPTHQPVEQVPSLRLIPNVYVWRPCDTLETAVAWQCALEQQRAPSCLSFSRQNVPFVQRGTAQLEQISRGGYVLRDCHGIPEAIIIATGSEVTLALQAADVLQGQGRRVRARVAVEAASADYWYKFVGLDGRIVGMHSFGASAPFSVLSRHCGFTVDAVVQAVNDILPS